MLLKAWVSGKMSDGKQNLQFFDRMIGLIPLSYYHPNKAQEEEVVVSNKFMHNKQGTAVNSKSHKMRKTIVEENADKDSKNESVVDAEMVAERKPESAGSSIENLRDLLHAKISSLNGSRQQKEKAPDQKSKRRSSQISKKSSDGDKASDISEKEESLDLMFAAIKQPKIDSGTSKETAEKKKKASNKKLLKKVEHFEAQVEQLKSKDKNLAEQLIHKKSVDSALLRATGTAVKDNKMLLKKAIKKKEKKKEASKKQWAERLSKVSKDKDSRMQKRKDNIEEKRQKKRPKRSETGGSQQKAD